MGASRTSNKDILDAILGLTAAITATHAAPAASPEQVAPSVTPEPSVEPSPEAPSNDETIRVSKQYHATMQTKAQAYADKVGSPVVMYARRNLNNEVKLAFTVSENLAKKQAGDRGFISKLSTYNPS